MFLKILQNTPRWVFALFVALLWLGLRQGNSISYSHRIPLKP